MPTILRSGPYRIYFVSHDLKEPPHVHVDSDDMTAKFWLDPLVLVRNLGFSAHELRQLETVIAEHREHLLEAWHDFFAE